MVNSQQWRHRSLLIFVCRRGPGDRDRTVRLRQYGRVLVAVGVVGTGRPVGERGFRAPAGTAVPRLDLLDQRGSGILAVGAVGPCAELDPRALERRPDSE